MVFTTIDPTLTPTASMGYQNIGPGNILDNGGFEIWQRGTSFSNPASGAYLADRWLIEHDGTPTYTISQESSIVDTGLYALKCNVTAASGTYMQFVEVIENYQAYAGKTVTLSMRIRSNVTGITIALYDGVSFVFSSPHPGDSTYHTLTATKTLSSSLTSLQVYWGFISGSGFTSTTGIIYADSAMLVLGSTPVTFVPLHPQVDLARCQRYYELSSGVGNVGCSPIPGFNNSNLFDVIHTYKVTKRSAPTVTISNVTASVSQICTVNISSAPVADDANWTSTAVVNSQVDSADIRFQRNSATTTWGAIRWGYTWIASADL